MKTLKTLAADLTPIIDAGSPEAFMRATLGNLVEPVTSLLARLVSGLPGMLVPGLLILAACLFACVFVDRAVDYASIGKEQ